jgi:hypothetical protein
VAFPLREQPWNPYNEGLFKQFFLIEEQWLTSFQWESFGCIEWHIPAFP